MITVHGLLGTPDDRLRAAATSADWVVAVTGVAGPDPQEGHAPGEVWIAIVGPRVGTLGQTIQAHRHQFSGDRAEIRQATVAAALELLQSVLSPV